VGLELDGGDGDSCRDGDGGSICGLRLLRTLDIKQMGVGLAVAVLLDATLIRGVLLPQP
jgi:hypothetical protein